MQLSPRSLVGSTQTMATAYERVCCTSLYQPQLADSGRSGARPGKADRPQQCEAGPCRGVRLDGHGLAVTVRHGVSR